MSSKFIRAEIITLPGEEAFFRFDEAQGVEKMLLLNFLSLRMVDQQSIPLFDLFNGELVSLLILDVIAFLEVYPDQWCGGKDILSDLLSSWETHFDAIPLRGDDQAKSEFRLGCAGPSLTGKGERHGRESGVLLARTQGQATV